MDAIEHVMLIEEEFGISIPDKDAADLWTVGQWDRYLCLRLPDIESSLVCERHRQVLARLLNLSPQQAGDIQAEHHLIRDLSFE